MRRLTLALLALGFSAASVALASACSSDDTTASPGAIDSGGIGDATIDQATSPMDDGATLIGNDGSAAIVPDGAPTLDAGYTDGAVAIQCVYNSSDASANGGGDAGANDAAVQCAPPASSCADQNHAYVYDDGVCGSDGLCHYDVEAMPCEECVNGVCEPLVGR